MKKITIITLCLLTLGSTVFAYDLSVGFGLVFGYINDSWVATDTQFDGEAKRYQPGGFAFFGTKYTEFNFSVRYSIDTYSYSSSRREDFRFLALSVGAYGKYPITLFEDVLVLFPTLGVDFDSTQDYLILWSRLGAGLDTFFNERVFFRVQALYGYGIPFLQLPDGYKSITPGFAPLIKYGLGLMF